MEIKYWLWLSRIEKLTYVQKGKLLDICKSPQNIWNLGKTDLIKIFGEDDIYIDEILNPKYRSNLEKYEDYILKNDIYVISCLDKRYPEKLKNIYDKPIVLYAKGNLEILNKKSIAMVGCRDCSKYGKDVAKKIAYELAKQGICIISGLAKGIDKYSHIGALQANGSTIAVLGNGLDCVYPDENRDLYKSIIENNGLIITEYIIGTRPDKMNFPARNRIISGLSDGIVVVEAKERSGSLITADFGLEHGKDIFAVPGNINSYNSVGTNDLIKQGAIVVTSYKDILEMF